jgi:hypothetical protein
VVGYNESGRIVKRVNIELWVARFLILLCSQLAGILGAQSQVPGPPIFVPPANHQVTPPQAIKNPPPANHQVTPPQAIKNPPPANHQVTPPRAIKNPPPADHQVTPPQAIKNRPPAKNK